MLQEKEDNKQSKPPSPILVYSLNEQQIDEDLLQVVTSYTHLY